MTKTSTRPDFACIEIIPVPISTLSPDKTLAIWGAMRARKSAETASADGFARMLATCLDNGVDWIDHADIYDDGQVEALHGEALSRLSPDQRQGLRLITKCGVRFKSPGQAGVRLHHYRSDAAFIRRQAEASLQALKCDQIDLYLLHRPDYLMKAEETARALEDLVREGKIAAFGVSNFSATQTDTLAAASTAHIAANQIELSPLHAAALDDGSLDHIRRSGMALLAWSPLGGSRLFDPQSPGDKRVSVVLNRLAETAGLDDPAIPALAWVRRLGALPILGTCRSDRLLAQVEGLRRFGEMDVQDWYEVLEAARGHRVP
ncbi:aldo/keto reductase [Maricaulis parjimensis]|uniref:aldo/keto reductase n=1 Tax=Maricaulis parjimensis TaxID=144023 RepID=UPI0019395C81|nr:aldo/keto reductase [Maricaulis parjimensis]